MASRGSVRVALFTRDAPVAVGVEALEHLGAHRVEFAAGELTIAIGVVATAGIVRAALHPLLLRDHAIIISVETRKHLRRMRKKFLARDLAVIVGVSPFQMRAVAAASAVTAMLAATRAPLLAVHLPVIVRVHLPEVRGAVRIELLARHCSIAVRVGGLEHAAGAMLTMVLSDGEASGRQRSDADSSE